MKPSLFLYTLLILSTALAGCRGDDIVYAPEDHPVDQPDGAQGAVRGFYMLNEGNMGMNASTLDYYDYSTGIYSVNVYAAANPDVPKELGDVGNDIAIYGSRMYVVVNCSNKVEVLDAATCRRLGQVDIPNCRYIAFDGPNAYVTSYAGPVEIGPEHAQKGYVARIDTASMQITGRCIVGYQPDGLCVADGRMYVANSGGYMVPNYENTLSVIDLATFQAVDTVVVAINLQYVLSDGRGALWVSSRGDYYGTPSAIYRYDLASRQVTDTLQMAAGSMWLDGYQLYVAGADFNYDTGDTLPTYKVVDTRTARVSNDCFVADPQVVASLVKPYGVAVNPDNGDIILTDAGNYVNPGYVYCLDRQGRLRWRQRAGDIPAHVAFRVESGERRAERTSRELQQIH